MHSSEGLSPPSHRIRAVEEFLPCLSTGGLREEDQFMTARQALQLPITTLAYIGDAWYEWQLRLTLLQDHQGPSGELNQASSFFSSAAFQAYLYASFEATCEDTEANLLRRARNHKSRSIPKHGDVQAYRLATAVEALLGFWLLSDQEQRARDLLGQAWQDASSAWSKSDQIFLRREVLDGR